MTTKRLEEIRERHRARLTVDREHTQDERDVAYLLGFTDNAQRRAMAVSNREMRRKLEKFTSLAVELEDKARLERGSAEWWDKGSTVHTNCIRLAEGYEDRAKEIYDILGLD